MVILEVMAAQFNKRWWKKLKKQQEKTFAQDEIMIRVQKVKLLQ